MNYHKINIYYLVIFIACFNCTFVISTTKSKAFYSVTPNRKLSNFSAIHTSTTRIRCITKCLGDMKCRYVSYLPLNGECQHSELEPNGATVILDIADGWESYAVPCDSGWFPFQSSCYSIVQETTDWDTAKTACESSGAHLAYIESEEEQNFLVDILTSDFGPNWYWLGARDIYENHSITWIDGALVSSGYTAWIPNQPDNGVHPEPNEFCVHMRWDFGYGWNDIPCDDNGWRICEKLS